MIRPIAALTRQVQEFFNAHLLGLYSWDDVDFAPREKIEKPPRETWPQTRRGRRIRPEMVDGKYRPVLDLQFGIWDLTVEGPDEHPPCGWLKLDGHGTIEGPLDPATWKQIGEHIKQYHTENTYA